LKPLIFGLLALLTLSGAPQDALPRVALSTPLGEIILEIDTRSAPVTAANFLRHVDAGLYDQGRFHRTVHPDNQPTSPIRIEVVQAMARETKTFPPILLERTSVTGLRHQNGTVSMAREKPDSASHQFFICLGDQPELDFGGQRNPDGQGFAAFGRVVSGLEVVRRIQAAPAEAQRLAPAIPIVSARRIAP
jgi:peptidyl-prolyl cis-trans isomerase A (cyclophilin A)